MTGTTDLPIRVCNKCGAVWMEDNQMYDDPNKCPGCGAIMGPPEYEGKPDPDFV